MRQVIKNVRRELIGGRVRIGDVMVTVDVEAIGRMLGERALGNKSHRSYGLGGLVDVAVLEGSIKHQERGQ